MTNKLGTESNIPKLTFFFCQCHFSIVYVGDVLLQGLLVVFETNVVTISCKTRYGICENGFIDRDLFSEFRLFPSTSLYNTKSTTLLCITKPTTFPYYYFCLFFENHNKPFVERLLT